MLRERRALHLSKKYPRMQSLSHFLLNSSTIVCKSGNIALSIRVNGRRIGACGTRRTSGTG
jgi:hypothetical protein